MERWAHLLLRDRNVRAVYERHGKAEREERLRQTKGKAVDFPMCHSPLLVYIGRVWVVCVERGGGVERGGDGSECAEWERRLGGL